ncbi:complex I intermediate-associated protein 30, mitochondrial-like [Tubulanus polymorphus]|uniref:complex I intermediate-associated protein 30, mitochondrial-like n=1 Tax=Tubulanus polymorphus TaxID=672921 RepID=UPI003DA47CE9
MGTLKNIMHRQTSLLRRKPFLSALWIGNVELLKASFWERRKGGYDTKIKVPMKEGIKYGLNDMKKEFAMLGREMKAKIEMDVNIMIEHGDYEYIWKADRPQAFKDKSWIVSADSDHGEGRSVANFDMSKEKKGLFHGTLDTRPIKDGVIKKAGYCNIRSPSNMKSFKRKVPYDWADYTHLVIRCRGDGRPYLLNIAIDAYFDVTWNDLFSYVLFTHGGPYWQVSKIPFSKFFRGSKGRIQDKQEKVILERVANFGITASNQYSGPFQLELDYVALYRDMNHTEEFAYEQYKANPAVVNV